MSKPEITKQVVDQTTQNIALVGRLIDELLSGSTILDEDARITPLVLLPVDDPDLARANTEMSIRMADRGQATRLQSVGEQPVNSLARSTADTQSGHD